ncbi:MAG: crossover junction endodeoxyribonuclease RuvC [Chitinispirillaceae bacterium]|nr:crossover junction endodeoxyribonuclease RuvC [Chitinispirillaceae bacterium]
MIILGIDPGTAVTGYGVIRADHNAVAWIDCGVITTSSGAPLPQRLLSIYDGIEACMDRYVPGRVAIEQAFYGKNVHTTLLLGHARGVLMLAAQKRGALISEYSPREIKKSITGNGNAEKTQVEYMVRMLLSVPGTFSRTDAFDALAVALCDFYHAPLRQAIGEAKNNRSAGRTVAGGTRV